jgi:hypothetical protein
VPGEDRDLEIAYLPQTLTAGVERRPTDDRRLAATWGQAVWRITLAASPPGRRGSARLEIRAAPPS